MSLQFSGEMSEVAILFPPVKTFPAIFILILVRFEDQWEVTCSACILPST